MKFRLIESCMKEDSDLPNYLYHATFGKYLDQIKEDGFIKIGKKKNYNFSNNVICLDADPFEAAGFADGSDNVSNEVYNSGIYILKIDTNKLDKSLLVPDKNLKPWSDESGIYGIGFEYSEDIPINAVIGIKKY